MAELGKAFMGFWASRINDLRRIAGGSRGEYQVDDLRGEAWIMAEKMGQRRGFPVDFANPIDQQHILARLYNTLVKFADKSIRFAVRLDKDWDSDDSGAVADSLSRLLTAPESFDPAVRFEADQDEVVWLNFVRDSYSQAAAYLILLNRFNWELCALAKALNVLAPTLEKRMIASGMHVRSQPSLFDRVVAVDRDFQAQSGRGIGCHREYGNAPEQLAWEFS